MEGLHGRLVDSFQNKRRFKMDLNIKVSFIISNLPSAPFL
jgi:hypothetical protein